jgi:TP901 family phage tail tape measure protein
MSEVTFDVDFFGTIKGATDAANSVKKLGKTLDSVGSDALVISKNMSSLGLKSTVAFENITDSIKGTSAAANAQKETLSLLGLTAKSVYQGMAIANQKADIVARGYLETNSALNVLMRDTDAKSRYSASQKKVNGELHKAELTTRELTASTSRLSAEEVKAANAAKINYDAQKYLATATERTDAAVTKLTADYVQATTIKGRDAAVTKVLVAAENELSTAAVKVGVALEKQNQQMRMSADAKVRAVANNKVLLDGLNKVATAEARQIVQQAQLAKEIRLTNSVRGKEILEQKKQLAALKATEKAQVEDVSLKAQRAAATKKLATELTFLRSAEGKAHVALQQAVSAERAALIASTDAQSKRNHVLRVGNQLTASMRATLAGLQTSIGMYTSSTILAASAAYALSRAIRSTITSGVEFQATMKRTSAIMGGAMVEASRTDMFAAMEGSIRSLGKTTQFTATEVASAMTELGQAGLTASQGMIALQPTLDLAIIGNLEMSRAADHATNVMMIFQKEAKDLTGIVDLMATAVTRSNTNVDQLANSLTYAGPAAKTMGIEIEDTTAAIASLANAGFKSNRSGTALRRMFVSLANPTAKGKAVLDRFNVSVVDLEGKTRSLTSILKQLSKGMEGLTGTEKLAAIQDLVGVYASSPISALVSQIDNFESLRRSMEYAGGAAARMKDEIEAALKFDAKKAFSAFQEAQLQVFDKVSQRLQILMLETSQWLTSLSQPFGDDKEVSKLDVYMVRFERLAKAVTMLGGAWLASKLSGSLSTTAASFTATSTAAAKTSVRFQQVALGGQQYSAVLHGQNSALTLNTVAQRVHHQALIVTNAAYTAGATALVWYNKGLAGLATGIGVVSKGLGFIVRGLGWVGLLYSTYEIFKSFLGDSSQEAVKEKAANIAVLGERYRALANNMDAVNAAETLASNKNTAEITKKSISNVEKEILNQEGNIDLAKAAGVDTTRFKDEIVGLKFQLQELRDSLVETEKQIYGAYEAASNELSSIPGRLKSIIHLRKQEAQQLELGNVKAAALIARRIAYQQESISLVLHATSAEADKASALDKINQAYEKGNKALAVSSSQLDNTKWDTYLEAMRAAAAAQDVYAQKKKELEEKPLALTADVEGVESALQILLSLQEAAVQAGKEFRNMSSDTEDIKRQILELQLTEEQRDAQRISNLEKIVNLRIAEDIAIASGQLSEEELAVSLKRRLDLYKRELNIRRDIKSDETKGGGGGASRTKRDPMVDRLKSAKTEFDNLRKVFDAAGAAQEDFEKSTQSLALLLEHNEITVEDHAKALQHLKSNYYDLTLAQDKNYQTIKRLQESYLTSSTQKQVDDLIALESAYAGVTTKG